MNLVEQTLVLGALKSKKKKNSRLFFCAANDFQIRVHWCDPLGMRAFSKQINVVECIQNDTRLRRSGSSEHRHSGVSTFTGTADHATYFNSMSWATICTLLVKLQHKIGDAPVKSRMKSMVLSIIITLQSRYTRDDHNMVVICLVLPFCMEKHVFFTEIDIDPFIDLILFQAF